MSFGPAAAIASIARGIEARGGVGLLLPVFNALAAAGIVDRTPSGFAPRRRRDPEPEPDFDIRDELPQLDPILGPRIFEIQRAAVIDWCRENCFLASIGITGDDIPEGGWTVEDIEREIQIDPDFADFIFRMTECQINANNPPTQEAVQQCFDFLEAGGDPADLAGDTAPRGPILARTGSPVQTPPVRRGIPGPTDQPVIRPRDRTSPTTPQVTGPEGPAVPPGVFPPILDPIQPELDAPPRREIELEPIDPGLFPERRPEIAPTAPQVELEPVETGLFPVRLPTVERLPVPGRAPTVPSPTTAPPTPLPAPTSPGVPGSVIGSVVGTITGAGIASTRRPVAAPGRGRTALPEPDVLPTPEPAPQPLSRTLRERIDECPPCEKEQPEEPREVCVHGLYKEQVFGTDFIGWAEYDCITGEWIRDLR